MRNLRFILPILLIALVIWAILPLKTTGQLSASDLESARIADNDVPAPIDIDSIRVPLDKGGIQKPIVKKYLVKYGDSFAEILKSLGIPNLSINKINEQIPLYMDLKDFQVGVPYYIHLSPVKKRPIQLFYEIDKLHPLVIDLKTNKVGIVDRPVDIKVEHIRSSITSSLYESILKAGAPEDLADKILSVFAWKIDFDHLKKGDSYQVIYEKTFLGNEVVGSQKILAASFTHDNVAHYGFAFDNGKGIEYFDEEGLNLNYGPLQFDRITSLYDRRRMHPVRGTYRSHLGMDFEAKTGTPVEAIKAGTILKAQYGRANGNNVKIEHTEDLSTQYLHLSRIDSSIVPGTYVEQGQIIGYVGSTGLSSGPHLCLRVWYKNKQRDPLDFDFPRRTDVDSTRMNNYNELVRNYQHQLKSKPRYLSGIVFDNTIPSP